MTLEFVCPDGGKYTQYDLHCSVTPGPWEVYTTDNYGFNMVFRECDVPRIDEEVGDWPLHIADDIPSINDAHLTAAAPDLLEACEKAGRYRAETGPELLRKVADILSANSYEEFAVDLRMKADREQAAIAKAKRGANG
jgi:hypothetical protein